MRDLVRPRAAWILAALLVASTAGATLDLHHPAPAKQPHGFPAIVFVSRQPLGEPGAVPGLGPHQRAAAPGGRLMLREPRGKVRELLPGGGLFDVSDPSVSPDARRIAFAGTIGAQGPWRIWIVNLDGSGLRALTADDPAQPGHDDDLDPCWIDERTIAFASTRGGARSEYDGGPVTQIWRLDVASGARTQLTSERNGAEEPARDPLTGEIVYSRWWFNRWRPVVPALKAKRVGRGFRLHRVTKAPAAPIVPAASMASDPYFLNAPPGASVVRDPSLGGSDARPNLWQAIAINADGSHPHLAAGELDDRRGESVYQPAILPDGTMLGVVGDELGLAPSPGATEVVWFPARYAAPRHVAGARFDAAGAPRYGSTRGLSAPSACSPAALPDGRLVLALDPGGRGDFGLWLMKRDGRDPACLVDLPGTLELDPAPVVPWRPRAATAAPPSRPGPPRGADALATWPATFRFVDRDVVQGAYGPLITALHRGTARVRIRFWAEVPGPDGADTLVMVRESTVARDGHVDERGLPAGLPMFEQLIDDSGRVLRFASGPAHVAGFNAGAPGGVTRCVGCHRGHSIED